MLPGLITGLAAAIILALPGLYNIWLKKRFYRDVPEELHYPITLSVYWAKEWAYKIAALLFLAIAVVVPFLIHPPAPGWLIQTAFLLIECLFPVLLAIGCWQAGNACRFRKLILEENFMTYIESPKHQVRIEKSNIERYWVGVEGSLVLQLKAQRRRLLIPLSFENIALINQSLISL